MWVAAALGRVFVLLLVLHGVKRCDSNEIMRCSHEGDCPLNGFCFKDECARCLCGENHHVINMFSNGKLIKMCEKRTPVPPKIGESCDKRASNGLCPYGSRCTKNKKICKCKAGLVPNRNKTHCRPPVWGEHCNDKIKCDASLGYECRGKPSTCQCRVDFHRPNRWTRFVLTRWDYTKVAEAWQDCVVRTVGENCESSAECAGVQGSGAICGPCGFCVCKIAEHEPDILGTKCGPGMGIGQTCSINSDFVCDGTRGLQCGDVCDLYAQDTRSKKCKCSQMHVWDNGACKRKTIGSPCATDLDCIPVREGFGFCEKGRCRGAVTQAGANYQPHLVDRKCKIPRRRPGYKRPTSSRPTYRRKKTKDGRITYETGNRSFVTMDSTTRTLIRRNGNNSLLASTSPKCSSNNSCLWTLILLASLVLVMR